MIFKKISIDENYKYSIENENTLKQYIQANSRIEGPGSDIAQKMKEDNKNH